MSAIGNTKDLRKAIRQGPYAWPGGYPLYFLTDDMETLSYSTVKANYRLVSGSIRHGYHDGWRVIGIDINWEDNEMVDAHTGERIESSYGE